MDADIIGGFPYADPNCKGCGKPLSVDNAWMTDGCPCNTELGVNSMNETRWRLLMQLQQAQARELSDVKRAAQAIGLIVGAFHDERTGEEVIAQRIRDMVNMDVWLTGGVGLTNGGRGWP